MSDARYKPPVAAVSDPETATLRPPRPQSVQMGLALLWVSLLTTILEWALDSLSGSAEWQDPTFVISAVITAGAALTFAAWINIMIGRGRNWARIVNLVLLCISVPVLLLWDDYATQMAPPVLAIHVFSWVTSIAGTVLVFTRTANQWFRAMRATPT